MSQASDLVWIYCPSCGRRIAIPFGRYGGPVPHHHQTSHCGARLIVLPSESRAIAVPEDVSLEAALTRALREEVGV